MKSEALQDELENNPDEAAADPSSCEPPKHWLLLEFPFLTASGFLSALDIVMNACEDPPDSDEEFYAQSVVKARGLAIQQMESLLEMALEEEGASSENARKTLGTMLISNCAGQPIEIKDYCLQRAAEALRFFSNDGLQEYLLDSIDICLTSNLFLPIKERMHLVHALMQCAEIARGQVPPYMTFRRCSRVLHEALLLEIQRTESEQSLRYSQILMDSMVSYPHHLAPATLYALSQVSSNQSLKEMAAAAYRAVTDSLEIRWLKTPADKLASLESRKNRLAQLCRSPRGDAYGVQTIFSNFKGCPIENADDPRLPALITLMSFNMDPLKMANCWSLYGQGEYNETIDGFVKGLDELAYLAINSGSAGLSHDAVKLLRALEKQSPELEKRIAEESEVASLRFVAAQGSPSNNSDDAAGLPLVEERD